jgi:hypothetical protein
LIRIVCNTLLVLIFVLIVQNCWNTGSSVSFCTESIMRQLGGTGKHKEITLNTMGSPLKMNTYMLDGLQVCDIDMNYMITSYQIPYNPS